MMKNDFHFTSKAFFVLEIFKILSSVFDHVEKQLDSKDKVSLKFYVPALLKTIVIHILPDISRGKGKQTTKFGQLI